MVDHPPSDIQALQARGSADFDSWLNQRLMDLSTEFGRPLDPLERLAYMAGSFRSSDPVSNRFPLQRNLRLHLATVEAREARFTWAETVSAAEPGWFELDDRNRGRLMRRVIDRHGSKVQELERLRAAIEGGLDS